ncbi:hypothetical protein PFISCL1PPCAC_22621, partial [Pristionchus fissidentatus]
LRADQTEYIVAQIEANREFIIDHNKKRSTDGNKKREDAWKTIVNDFNEKFFAGKPNRHKSVEQIQGHWKRKKVDIRKRLVAINAYRNLTGGGFDADMSEADKEFENDSLVQAYLRIETNPASTHGIGDPNLETGFRNVVEYAAVKSKEKKSKKKNIVKAPHSFSPSLLNKQEQCIVSLMQGKSSDIANRAKALGFNKTPSKTAKRMNKVKSVDEPKVKVSRAEEANSMSEIRQFMESQRAINEVNCSLRIEIPLSS